MAISTEKREGQSFALKVGLAEGTVIAINPDAAGLNKLFGKEDSEEPVYVSEDTEGHSRTRVVVWLETKEGVKLPMNILLTDKEMESKTGSFQWVNQACQTMWAKTKEELPQWFTHFTKKDKKSGNVEVLGDKRVWKARQGEAELYEFFAKWYQHADFFKPTADIDLEWKKLMNGNTKILQGVVGNEMTGTIMVNAMVRSVEKDGEIKEYQSVPARYTLHGYQLKNLLALDKSKKSLETIRIKKEAKEKLSIVERYFMDIKDIEYGPKDYYILDVLQNYDTAENVAASTEPIASASSSDAPADGSY